MFNIIENPITKELFLTGNDDSMLNFAGTPYSNSHTKEWEVIAQAPCAKEWFANPGNYRTYYGSMSVTMIDNKNKLSTFVMGESIGYLRNWVIDASANNDIDSLNHRAFSDRNVAINKSSY